MDSFSGGPISDQAEVTDETPAGSDCRLPADCARYLTCRVVLRLLQEAVVLRELSDPIGCSVAERGGVRQPGGVQVAAGVRGRGGGALLELSAARRLQAPPALVVGVFGVVAAVLHAVRTHEGAVEHCGGGGGEAQRSESRPFIRQPGGGSGRVLSPVAPTCPLGRGPPTMSTRTHTSCRSDSVPCDDRQLGTSGGTMVSSAGRDAQRTTHNTRAPLAVKELS